MLLTRCSLLTLLVATVLCAFEPAGTWTGELTLRRPNREVQRRDVTLTLKISASAVTGILASTWQGQQDSAELLDAKLTGNDLSFFIATGAADVPRLKFTGKPEGDRMTLTVTGIDPRDGKEIPLGDCSLQRSK